MRQTMHLPYYFVAVVFLGSILAIIIVLIIIYKISLNYLDGKYAEDSLTGETTDSADEEYYPPFIKVQDKETPKEPKENVLHRRTLSVIQEVEEAEEAQQEEASSSIPTELGKGNIEVGFRYLKENSYLSGMIQNVSGFPSIQEKGPTRIRFHLTLSMLNKVRKQRTAYISTSKVKLVIPWSFKNVKENDIATSSLRLRLYGRREKLGVAVGRDTCYGEAFLYLNKIPLSEEGAIVTTTLIQTAPQFPTPEKSDF